MKTPDLPAIRAAFQRDGYVIIPDLLSASECAALKTEARRVLEQNAAKGASVYVHVAVVSPMFRLLSEDARVVDVLDSIMTSGVMFLSDKIVFKAADKKFPTPWHIDAFYWRDTRPKISVWIPLDDASAENGTLTVVPGSHTQDWEMVKKGLPNGEFGDEVGNVSWTDRDVATCNIARGSAVFFSDRLVHGSTPNQAGRDRYAIIGTYHAPAEDDAFDKTFPARKVLRRRAAA